MAEAELFHEVANWPRQYGKTAVQDRLIEEAVALGEHVHQGLECVTGECAIPGDSDPVSGGIRPA